MVMFNLYFRNRLPFTDVYIHPMMQDGEGRKMSKSLGNGVDPLDIIHSHGADAMRFTLATMATNTQDVRMPVEKDPTTGREHQPEVRYRPQLLQQAVECDAVCDDELGAGTKRRRGTE